MAFAYFKVLHGSTVKPAAILSPLICGLSIFAAGTSEGSSCRGSTLGCWASVKFVNTPDGSRAYYKPSRSVPWHAGDDVSRPYVQVIVSPGRGKYNVYAVQLPKSRSSMAAPTFLHVAEVRTARVLDRYPDEAEPIALWGGTGAAPYLYFPPIQGASRMKGGRIVRAIGGALVALDVPAPPKAAENCSHKDSPHRFAGMSPDNSAAAWFDCGSRPTRITLSYSNGGHRDLGSIIDLARKADEVTRKEYPGSTLNILERVRRIEQDGVFDRINRSLYTGLCLLWVQGADGRMTLKTIAHPRAIAHSEPILIDSFTMPVPAERAQ